MSVLTRLSAEAFDAFVALPEQADQLFELVGGELVEVPSNPYSSQIAALISAALVVYLRGKNLGHVTGESGGYRVSGERYAPDVAFITKARQPELPYEGYNPQAPDLAVEVVSPSDTDKRLRVKIANYLAANTQVWVVYPQAKEVEVYKPGQPVQIVGLGGTLEADDILLGFKLPVAEIFPD